MSTNIIFDEKNLRMILTPSPVDMDILRIGGQFIRIKKDMSMEVQTLPEMTDEEVLKANEAAGGFAWLKDPAEDIYEN